TLDERGIAIIATTSVPEVADAAAGDTRPAESLAALALPLVEEGLVGGVVASGGDTVAALCRRLGAGLLELGEDILPGMPRASMLDGASPGLRLVTKSGGFGPPDALLLAVRALYPRASD